MALTIGDNFSYQGAKPLDGRIKYDTLAAMKAMADSTLYDGCLAYCVATDKTYQWKSTNTVDTDTGKWREFTSGGGTGGGHTIEDPEGTALTQRDTLQFGGDLEVSDDDENEKTVVAPHELTTAELTEIMSTLPGQPTQGITIDLRGNEQVVGKVIESDGTEKMLYQKTITVLSATISDYVDYDIDVSTFLDNSHIVVRDFKGGYYIDKGGNSQQYLFWGNMMKINNVSYGYNASYRQANSAIRINGSWGGKATYTLSDLTFTLCYTKTTT